MRRTILLCALIVAALGIHGLDASAAEELDGRWTGKVVADAGEMPITVSLTVKNGAASGTIETFHGAMTITDGRLVEGRWVLPFAAADGTKGRMSGVVKGDAFTGEWDYRPQAVGTFSLTRAK